MNITEAIERGYALDYTPRELRVGTTLRFRYPIRSILFDDVPPFKRTEITIQNDDELNRVRELRIA